MSIATFLKNYRKKAQKTQADIAHILQIPKTTYRQWELGLREPPPYVQTYVKQFLSK